MEVEPVTRWHWPSLELDNLGCNEAGKVPESQRPPACGLKPGPPLAGGTEACVPGGVSAGERTTHVAPFAFFISHRRNHRL